MALPNSSNARLFYRAAVRRMEEATMLYNADCISAGPVYLAGYCIECIRKALILSSTPAAQHDEVLARFRGCKAHNYVWLREAYSERSGIRLPHEIVRTFTLVSDWSTDLR